MDILEWQSSAPDQGKSDAFIIGYRHFARLIILKNGNLLIDRGYRTKKGAKIGYNKFMRSLDNSVAHRAGAWCQPTSGRLNKYPMISDLLDKLFFLPSHIGFEDSQGV